MPTIGVGQQGIRCHDEWQQFLVLDMLQKARITTHRMHDSFCHEHSAALMAPLLYLIEARHPSHYSPLTTLPP